MTLFALFFVGGMAGSTAGGIKAVRVLLLLKHTGNEIRKNLHPRAVIVTRIGDKPVKDDVVANVVGFVILYLLICLVGAILLGFMGMQPLTAISASLATVGNIGPGFGDVGAVDSYGWMSSPALMLLSFLMLVGRLEIFTVLVLFHRETWKARRSYH
jgi:trk system potassium uptake protein